MKSADPSTKVDPSARKVIPLPRGARRDRHELAFLPAALEIVETPPSPIGRAIGVTIIALFCLGLAWASLGEVDIISSAPGKIIPNGRTKVIQSFESGVVRAIHVRDGQSVHAGEVLIELDPTMNEAERNHLRSDLTSAQLDSARLRAALGGAPDPVAAFRPPEAAPANLVAMQRQFLASQESEFGAKIASLDRQRAQKEAERATIAATIAKLDAMIPLISQRLDMRKALMEKELGSKIVYLETLQQVVEQRQEREVQQSRYREAEAALAAVIETRAQAEAEHSRALSSDLVEAERKAAGLSEDLVKAEQRTKFQVLTAPVDGVVQQVAIHTIGGVVTPAQALLAVVPDENRLEIEAMVSNREIGFVRPGQQAEIKVDTFPFTRYGLLHGTVLSVSQDAIMRDKPQEATANQVAGAEASTSEPKGQELVYAARISLDRTQMQIDGNVVKLSPGMAVTVEIKTGSRTVISYLFSPLTRYKQESLRER
jgi:hemolysin D